MKKVQCFQKKHHCPWTLLRGEKSQWIFHNLENLLRPLELVPASRERVVPTEWQVRRVLGDCIPRARVIPAHAPQHRQYALIRRAEASEPYIGHQDGTVYKQFSGKSNCRCPLRNNKRESLGSRKQLILHGNPSPIARDFSPHMAVLRRHFFLLNVHFKCCLLLHDTLGDDFDIFAASSESTAWTPLKNPFKNNWREGLSCRPIRLFQHRI